MSGNRWEHFPHEADMGIRGIGKTREAAFEQAALALTSVITNITDVAAVNISTFRCQAHDDELLFVDWLNALIYEMATGKQLFSRFEIQIKDHELTARAWGESLDVAKHRPAVEIKGATYSALRVVQDTDGVWIAQCVVDV